MKRTAFALWLACISAAGTAADMKDMDMKGMDMSGMKMAAPQAQTYRATGIVKELDPSGNRVTISHQPVEALGWPAMTMTFSVEDSKLREKLHAGAKIKFEFVKKGKSYLITKVK